MPMSMPEVLPSTPSLSKRALSGGALRAEDLLPSLTYKELVEQLGPLTELGVFEENALATALVVRAVGRSRTHSAVRTACAGSDSGARDVQPSNGTSRAGD
jgi:hypothetical protein